jgi:hypothetical protein
MSLHRQTSRRLFFALIVGALGVQAAPAGVQVEALIVPELDAGFRLLYELKLEEARAQFAVWQAAHPEDPLGSASEAASYLFEECYRQGVLTSEFLLDNKRFLGKVAIKPDLEIRKAFFAADLRAQEPGHAGRLCQSDRDISWRASADSRGRHVCQ